MPFCNLFMGQPSYLFKLAFHVDILDFVMRRCSLYI